MLPLVFAPFCQCIAQAPASTKTFHDPTYHISFDYPANWNFTRSDREISTFRLDARSAAKSTTMRAVVAMSSNPFPASTFSGAYVYFSVTPHSSARSCAQQASSQADGTRSGRSKPGQPIGIADIPFTHGHDEQTEVCVVQHDEVYTTLHHGACYRFDLAINNFCNESSGVQDISLDQLDQVRARLQSILRTVRFDPKK